MISNKKIAIRIVLLATITFAIASCSSQKNTKVTRLYHDINTRYNIHFNAQQAYDEALLTKNASIKDVLSELISIYPSDDNENAENAANTSATTAKSLGPFSITIEKCVKAIKLHSITAKPQKNPSKSKDPKYQSWLKQKEFNPFLKNSWLLMGKAQFQNKDYFQSATTFLYITRLFKNEPEVVAEARLWTALAYTQLSWYYEADNIFHQIQLEGGVPVSQKKLFAEVYANYLIRNKHYESAIPELQQAIENQTGIQKIRLKYLLAQLYAETGDKQKAYEAYGNVPSMNAPYEYTFNAEINQLDFSPIGQQSKAVSILQGMAKKTKNKTYLDRVYYAIGNIYIQQNDTINAIKNYDLGIKKSTRNAYDKGLCQVALGDLYFSKRDYGNAQPCYLGAVSTLPKKYKEYPRVALRSEMLNDLVVYVKAVQLQDSIQNLARMPEADRLKVINKVIADLVKKESEEQRADFETKPEEGFSGSMNGTLSVKTQDPIFYFYNEQTVSQGVVTFQKQWGTRKLEDNWRRKNKQDLSFEDAANNESDTIKTKLAEGNTATKESEKDPHKPEYYLQQLPFTPEAINASDTIIDDALYNEGLIYKNKLGDFGLAIDAFTTDIRRFPKTANLENVEYQLFLTYLQIGDKVNTELYRRKILADFPKGDNAIALSDPNWEWNMTHMGEMQNSLYDETYDAYLMSKKSVVRSNYEIIKRKYPQTDLMPKFMLLNALTYAQEAQTDKFKEGLKEIVSKYPNADVTPFATDMLKGVLAGRALSKDGRPTRGMIWDIHFDGVKDVAKVDSTTQFIDKEDEQYQLLFAFQPSAVDKNELIYQVANYNFSNFVVQTFDLSFNDEVEGINILQIKGFHSFADVVEYLAKAFGEKGLIERLSPTIIPIPISVDNYKILLGGKSLNDYFEFYQQHLGKQTPELLTYWEQQKSAASNVSPQPKKEEPKKIVNKNQPVDVKVPEKNTIDSTQMGNKKDKAQSSIDSLVEKEPTLEKARGAKAPEIPALGGGVNPVQKDSLSEQLNSVNELEKSASDIIANPVDGLKKLFESATTRPKLTKEEKEQLKQEHEQQKLIERQQKEVQKAVQDSIAQVQKKKDDAIKNAQEEKIRAQKDAEQKKKDDAKAVIKAREDKLRQREKDQKEKEKKRKEELKAKEKERNEKLKKREKDREQKLKQQEKAREDKLKASKTKT